MRILFTGASSFTGSWFVKALAQAGHEVIATFQREHSEYEGSRRTRVDEVIQSCTPEFGCSFGSGRFMNLVATYDRWDLLCHHAAEVGDYRSPDFDVHAAVRANTEKLAAVLAALGERGCGRMLLTGSVFEQGEGAGSGDLEAFSPYGVSKGMTAMLIRYHASKAGFHLGKFVIANPFGPYEEPRFTAYLVRTWLDGATAEVRTPLYVRDNIHVDLLAAAYSNFAARLPARSGFSKLNPSGYVENQGQFARRFADAFRQRTDLACRLDLANQVDFDEPIMRINTDPVPHDSWSEHEAWDALVEYYLRPHG